METEKLQELYTKVLNKVKSGQNGPASDTMKRMGLNYELNYGVSIVKLKEISKDHFPNTELANFLLKKNIRESKILAYMIFDFENMSEKTFKDVLQSVENHELAEQFSTQSANKIKVEKLNLESLFFSDNEYQLTAVCLLYSRLAQVKKTYTDDFFLQLINRVKSHTQSDNIHLIKAVSRALRTIALRNDKLKTKVIETVKLIKKDNTDQSALIYEEVIPLIN